MEKWQHDGNLKCLFCHEGADSHDHLFFQCQFTWKIWEYMRSMTQMVNISSRMEDIMQEIGDKHEQNSISERNSRIFRKEERTAEDLCRIIKDNVRFKLLALKVKKSKRVIEMAAMWNLSWRNNTVYAS
uniref:uncharacterized protein LOC122599395 n=1 Tax=Erigeron canadensis TaxID=72917 RepID=UPI001CB98396|nr:uncharacterized protein LOC122599395 [Erigeron canadensis]